MVAAGGPLPRSAAGVRSERRRYDRVERAEIHTGFVERRGEGGDAIGQPAALVDQDEASAAQTAEAASLGAVIRRAGAEELDPDGNPRALGEDHELVEEALELHRIQA